MFGGTYNFNQYSSLENWDISQVNSMENIFQSIFLQTTHWICRSQFLMLRMLLLEHHISIFSLEGMHKVSEMDIQGT